MKLIAKTREGTEYLHSRSNCYFAHDSSAKKMCEMLNGSRYKLNDSSEKWQVYDFDYSQTLYVEEELFLSRGVLKSRVWVGV